MKSDLRSNIRVVREVSLQTWSAAKAAAGRRAELRRQAATSRDAVVQLQQPRDHFARHDGQPGYAETADVTPRCHQ